MNSDFGFTTFYSDLLTTLAGHDVATVRGQGMTSMPDEQLIDVCRREGRCLLTLARDFGNRIRYNPSEYAGIVVIRLPSRPSFEDWREAVETLLPSRSKIMY